MADGDPVDKGVTFAAVQPVQPPVEFPILHANIGKGHVARIAHPINQQNVRAAGDAAGGNLPGKFQGRGALAAGKGAFHGIFHHAAVAGGVVVGDAKGQKARIQLFLRNAVFPGEGLTGSRRHPAQGFPLSAVRQGKADVFRVVFGSVGQLKLQGDLPRRHQAVRLSGQRDVQ